jgi:hypothetical protein
MSKLCGRKSAENRISEEWTPTMEVYRAKGKKGACGPPLLEGDEVDMMKARDVLHCFHQEFH